MCGKWELQRYFHIMTEKWLCNNNRQLQAVKYLERIKQFFQINHGQHR